MTLDDLTLELQDKIPQAKISCTGTPYHVYIQIISSDFDGLNTLKRHQKIYPLLKTHVESQALHAITLKTLTPQEALEV